MKSLKQLTEVSKDELPPIYCDMDQVLCNFMKRADEVTGGFVKSNKEEKWKEISNTKDFWADLDWMSGAKRMYQIIIKYDAHILSAASGRDSNSKPGKMKWISKNTKFPRGKIHLVNRSQKQAYAMTAGKPNILIDDYIKNIREWEAKGGIARHHTNVSKTINELKRLGFK